MTITVLPVPGRLSMTHLHDPELIERVREARARLCQGEDVSALPFDLTNVTNFRGRITARWRRDDEESLYQRMLKAREQADG